MSIKNNILKRITGIALFMFVMIAGFLVTAKQVHAIGYDNNPEYAPSLTWYNGNSSNSNGPGKGTNKSIANCVPEVTVLGEAFVHGGNGVVDKSGGIGRAVDVQCYVSSDSARDSVYIQGNKIDRGWIVRGNIQHLWNLHHTPSIVGNINYAVSDKNIGWPSDPYSYEFYAYEGEKFQIVDYDKNWVYIWSTGLKAFENNSTGYCKNWLLLRSHPAGFYRISRDYVWVNLYNDNTFAKDSDKIYGEGYATVSLTDLYHIAGNTETGPCYQVDVNTKFQIVDPDPVTVTVDGKEKSFYKVQFKGKNDTYYMGYRTYHVYVESKYLNVYKYNSDGKVTVPENVCKAYIYKPSVTVSPELMYTEKSTKSEKIYGALGDGAKIYVDYSQSDEDWVAVLFNDSIGWVEKKRIVYYIDNLWIKDIKDNKYVLSWGTVPDKVLVTFKDKKGNKVTTNRLYVANVSALSLNNSLFEGREGFLYGVTVTAKVKDSSISDSIHLLYPAKASKPFSRSVSNNRLTINNLSEGGELQYSANKNFKNPKTVITTSTSATIKNLKKNTTYYFRFRNRLKVKTANGTKILNGDWSKTVKVKTTNITMKTPVIKTPKGSKKFATIYWQKYTGTANHHEIVVATDKKFTKNVKKTVASKSMTSIGIDNLKSNKTYYVRMRSIYNHYGQTYKSSWSKVKSFKTK